MNCHQCQSLKISRVICDSKEISRCWGCGFVVTKKVDCPDYSEAKVKPKQEQVKRRYLAPNPPNAIDYWLWSHGTAAMSGANAMKAEK